MGFSEAGRHSSSAGQSWVFGKSDGSHKIRGTRSLVFPLRRVTFPNSNGLTS
ncbi:unnamed protein product [Brassica oleracea var. botrytis]